MQVRPGRRDSQAAMSLVRRWVNAHPGPSSLRESARLPVALGFGCRDDQTFPIRSLPLRYRHAPRRLKDWGAAAARIAGQPGVDCPSPGYSHRPVCQSPAGRVTALSASPVPATPPVKAAPEGQAGTLPEQQVPGPGGGTSPSVPPSSPAASAHPPPGASLPTAKTSSAEAPPPCHRGIPGILRPSAPPARLSPPPRAASVIFAFFGRLHPPRRNRGAQRNRESVSPARSSTSRSPPALGRIQHRSRPTYASPPFDCSSPPSEESRPGTRHP